MKTFVVEQIGQVQIEATRIFVVEVPDHTSEDEIQELLEEMQSDLPDNENMAWEDETKQKWSGYNVEDIETVVSDPGTVMGGPSTEGLSIVQLEFKE